MPKSMFSSPGCLRPRRGKTETARMDTNQKPLNELSAAEKRAHLADLLRRKISQPKVLPPSFAQQRLLFLDGLQPGSPLYNIPAAVRLRMPIDLPTLQRSIDEIVRRHEALRTTFRSVNGQSQQVIMASLK